MTIKDDLAALFDAERKVRSAHTALVGGARTELVDELRKAASEASTLDDEDEAALRLTRLATLLGDLDGPDVVDVLVDILTSEHPEPRITAGEALEGLAFDRFKEVALGIERALERLPVGSPALSELPFLLAEVAEPGCVKLLGRFLKHEDANAVASAIEALAELGDPSAIPLLRPLERDARQVELDEEGETGERIAIGDLAHEACELLAEMAADAEPASKTSPANRGRGPRR